MIRSAAIALLIVLVHQCISIPSELNILQYKPQERKLEDYLLPKTLNPISYNIRITPYLENPLSKLHTFDGEVTIRFLVKNITTQIIIHAHEEIEIIGKDSLTLRILNSFPPTIVPISNFTRNQNDTNFLIINLSSNLTVTNEYALRIVYNGKLNDDLKGFYKSSYMDNGVKRWLAVTKLEPYSARRVFPCFDEPNFKARFTINVAREPGYKVVSNMPILAENEEVAGLPGWSWVIFQESEVMSTYLVAFSVNQFELIKYQEGGRDLTLRARPTAVQQGEYANSIVSPKVMEFMEQFTQYKYVLPKMDQLAIPDFASGAMENWGMVTYRETYLLYEEGITSSKDRQMIASVVAHELSHQWFGNLVSPEWWNNLWLNEGFATFFEFYATAHVEPTWQMREQFVIESMHTVLQTDALSTTHAIIVDVDNPDSLDSMFDVIAYNKGGCMVRMMAAIMGEQRFKAGIKNYFDDRKFSTASAEHLWLSLQTQVPPGALPSKVNMSHIMETWTLQPGYPVITIERDYERNRANISQDRFFTTGSTPHEETWVIPVTFTSQDSSSFTDFQVKLWHTSSGQVTLNEGLPAADKWIIGNTMQAGYYRVNYDVKNWQMIIDSLNKNTIMQTIHVINRAQIMDDALALARAKLLNYNIAIETTSYLSIEKEYIPWASGLNALGYLSDRLYDDESRPLFETYVLDKMEHMYTEVEGFNVSINDSHMKRLTQTLILSWACKLRHERCDRESNALFTFWQEQFNPDIINPVNPDLKSVVYCTGMQNGAKTEYDFLFERYEAASNVASEQALIINALGCSQDTELLKSFLNESKTPNSRIRRQDAHLVVTAVYNNRLGVDPALDFLLSNFQLLPQLYGGYGRVNRVFTGISVKLNTEEQKSKIEEYIKTNNSTLNTEGVNILTNTIKTLEEILKWHQEHKQNVVQYFKELLKSDVDSANSTMFSTLLFVICLSVLILK